MNKQVTAVFTLSSSEIDEAFYDIFVRKLRASNISAVFSEKDIKVDFNDFLEVSLRITEENEI